jgi:hypothetical protein
MLKFKALAICATVVAVAAISSKSSAQIYTDSFAGITDWSHSLSVSQYNGANPLISVKITLDTSVTQQGHIENGNPDPADFTAKGIGDVTMAYPTGGNLTGHVVNDFGAFTLLGSSLPPVGGFPDFDGMGGDYVSFGPKVGTDSNFIIITNPIALAAFIGGGNVSFLTNATGTSAFTGPGNADEQILTNATAKVTVEYTSRPLDVPEPSTVAFLGTSMLSGVGFLIRRRVRK